MVHTQITGWATLKGSIMLPDSFTYFVQGKILMNRATAHSANLDILAAAAKIHP